MWQQMSRVDWLQYRDRNTKFFHLSTLVRRRENRSEVLQAVDGYWAVDPVMLKEMDLEYYKSLYKADPLAVGEFQTGCFLVSQERSNSSWRVSIRRRKLSWL